MFNLIRVAFLTLVNAYRPVFGRPQRLSGLVLRPVLIALFFIFVVVPFAQQLMLWGYDSPPVPAAPVVERLTHRLPVFVADMLAVIPWLWLASVLMMRWPHVRRSISPSTMPKATDFDGKVWKSTALMFGPIVIIALLLEINVQMMEHLGEASDTFDFGYSGSPGGPIGFISLVLLARYGLALHGLAIGHPMSFRESARRLAGRSYRVFWSLLVIGCAAAYSPISSDQSWFTGVSTLLRFGNDARQTGTALETGVIVDVFMFAFAACAIAEVIARAYSATESAPTEARESPVPARA